MRGEELTFGSSKKVDKDQKENREGDSPSMFSHLQSQQEKEHHEIGELIEEEEKLLEEEKRIYANKWS